MNSDPPPVPRLRRRAKWDLAVGILGFVYVVLVLALSLDAPVFSILYIGLASYELFAGRG